MSIRNFLISSSRAEDLGHYLNETINPAFTYLYLTHTFSDLKLTHRTGQNVTIGHRMLQVYIVAMQFLMCKMMTSFVSSGLTKATLKMHRNA